jgi:hypothetical protein
MSRTAASGCPAPEMTMNVLTITFTLDGMTPAEYHAMAEQIAPAFAEVPGLSSKIWLADEAAGVYGGVYLFIDRPALDAYLASDLLEQAAATPGLTGFTSTAYDVLEAPTAVTGRNALAVA